MPDAKEVPSLGRAIKEARRAKRMTQEALADRLGVHKMTVVKYEADQLPITLDRLTQIAEALSEGPITLLRRAGFQGGEADLTFVDPSTNQRVDIELKSPPARHGERPPRLQRNLPFEVRKYLAEFRLRLTNAHVPDEEIDEALELMQSPQLFTFYKGGVPSDYNEEEVLRGMKAIGEGVVIPELRDRGRKIP